MFNSREVLDWSDFCSVSGFICALIELWIVIHIVCFVNYAVFGFAGICSIWPDFS